MGASASISNSVPYDIILFDGVCNLCNGAVTFIIQRDPNQRFKFSPLQSSLSQALIAQNKIEFPSQSIVLIRNQKVFERSDAALEIVRHLSGIWPIFFVFKVIPKFIRDALYNFVAKNRYRIFGRRESCMIPTPELKKRFIGE